MSMITIIGRGHSGTRAISHTLYTSNVYMGSLLNPSGDLVPPEAMYEACRVLASHVNWKGGLEWDFSQLHTMQIPEQFERLISVYLKSVLADKSENKGWKIPETTLAYPWIVRMFPEIKYVFWIRNPRDCILGRHITDDLTDFGIPYPKTDDVRLRRAISWKYQYDLVKSTPRPAHWLEVRFEDFVLKQEETLQRLEDFLGFKMARIIVRRDSIERWKLDDGVNYFDFFAPAMIEYGYEIPEREA
jgi:Sulfotransferase family